MLREKPDIIAMTSGYEGVKSYKKACEFFHKETRLKDDIADAFNADDFRNAVEESAERTKGITVNINGEVTLTKDSLPSNDPNYDIFSMEGVNVIVTEDAVLTIQRDMRSEYDAFFLVEKGGTLIIDNTAFGAYMTNLVVAPGGSVYFKNGASYRGEKGSIINHGTFNIDGAYLMMNGTFYNAKAGSVTVSNQGGIDFEPTSSSANLEIYNYADDDYTPSTHYCNRGNMTFSNATFSMIYRGSTDMVFEAEPFVNAGTMKLSCSPDTKDLTFHTEGHFQNFGTIILSGGSNSYMYICFRHLFENYGTLDVSEVSPEDIYLDGKFLNYEGAVLTGMSEIANDKSSEIKFYDNVVPNR